MLERNGEGLLPAIEENYEEIDKLTEDNQRLQEELKKLNQELGQLRQVARTDPMTQIDTRRGLDIEVGKLADKISREEDNILDKTCIFLMLDLNDLKDVNDTKGHEAGDKYILKTAQFLKENFRPSDEISRLDAESNNEENQEVSRVGGDEFIVFLVSDEDISKDIEGRLKESLASDKYRELNMAVGIIALKVRDLVNSLDIQDQYSKTGIIKERIFEIIQKDLDKKMYEAKELAKQKGTESKKVTTILREKMKF